MKIKIRYTTSILVLFLFSHLLNGQITPLNNSTINYTQVLFEIPEVPKAEKYIFLLIENNGDFHNPLIQKEDKSQVTIIEDLEFGVQYKWKVRCYDKNDSLLSETEEYYFEIGSSQFIDTTKARFRVLKNNSEENFNGVVFLDYSGVAINKFGKPVWFLPEMERMNVVQDRIRDLKLTHSGTITFNAMKFCREVSLMGTTLWETPMDSSTVSGVDKEFYHHEFTKQRSGNYLALAKKYRNQEIKIGDQKIDKIPLSVIVEYNSKGDTVWTWDSDNYITASDIRAVGKKVLSGNTFGHMNAAFINETNNEVYASMRDLNVILVIDKNTKRVLRTYGDKIPSDTSKLAIGFFSKQHSPVLIDESSILLFDNGDQGKDAISKVVVFTQAIHPGDSVRKKWEFSCNFDSLMPSYSPRMGNAFPLDSTQFIVNMGSVARLFQVAFDKKVTWDCLPEKWNDELKAWKPQPNYRLSYASSLYPCYFSVSLKEKHDTSKVISIHNEGTESDTYFIKLIPLKRKKMELSIRTPLIGVGEVYEITKELVRGKVWEKGCRIIVTSANNDRLVKECTYRF